MQPVRKQQGFTLLEALIAIVVFSIGLLGIASLQIIGLKLNGNSLLRTMAAIQANDMIDRMRANIAATRLGVSSPYNNGKAARAEIPACLGRDGSGTAADVSCTSTQMAQHDNFEWYAAILGAPANAALSRPTIPAAFPSGDGIVCVDSTPNDGTSAASPACDNVVAVPGEVVFAVKIWWIERRQDQTAATVRRYVQSFAL